MELRRRKRAGGGGAEGGACVSPEEFVNGVAASCRRLVVFTGSGLSASSGMSMFSTRNGLYDRARKKFKIQDGIKLFTYSFYKQRRAEVQAFFAQIYSEAQGSQAAPGHHALADIAAMGCIIRHYTLNIDGLAEAVGMSTWHHEDNPKGSTVEMHGNIRQLVCPSCHAVEPLSRAHINTMKALQAVQCPACQQDTLRFKIMLYDDDQGDCITPEHVFETLEEDLESADCVLWVGISFEQSASVEYFRRVRSLLASLGRLDKVTQAVINPSDDAYFNIISSMCNVDDLRLLDVRAGADTLLPELAKRMRAYVDNPHLSANPDDLSRSATPNLLLAAGVSHRCTSGRSASLTNLSSAGAARRARGGMGVVENDYVYDHDSDYEKDHFEVGRGGAKALKREEDGGSRPRSRQVSPEVVQGGPAGPRSGAPGGGQQGEQLMNNIVRELLVWQNQLAAGSTVPTAPGGVLTTPATAPPTTAPVSYLTTPLPATFLTPQPHQQFELPATLALTPGLHAAATTTTLPTTPTLTTTLGGLLNANTSVQFSTPILMPLQHQNGHVSQPQQQPVQHTAGGTGVHHVTVNGTHTLPVLHCDHGTQHVGLPQSQQSAQPLQAIQHPQQQQQQQQAHSGVAGLLVPRLQSSHPSQAQQASYLHLVQFLQQQQGPVRQGGSTGGGSTGGVKQEQQHVMLTPPLSPLPTLPPGVLHQAQQLQQQQPLDVTALTLHLPPASPLHIQPTDAAAQGGSCQQQQAVAAASLLQPILQPSCTAPGGDDKTELLAVLPQQQQPQQQHVLTTVADITGQRVHVMELQPPPTTLSSSHQGAATSAHAHPQGSTAAVVLSAPSQVLLMPASPVLSGHPLHSSSSPQLHNSGALTCLHHHHPAVVATVAGMLTGAAATHTATGVDPAAGVDMPCEHEPAAAVHQTEMSNTGDVQQAVQVVEVSHTAQAGDVQQAEGCAMAQQGGEEEVEDVQDSRCQGDVLVKHEGEVSMDPDQHAGGDGGGGGGERVPTEERADPVAPQATSQGEQECTLTTTDLLLPPQEQQQGQGQEHPPGMGVQGLPVTADVAMQPVMCFEGPPLEVQPPAAALLPQQQLVNVSESGLVCQ